MVHLEDREFGEIFRHRIGPESLHEWVDFMIEPPTRLRQHATSSPPKIAE
jgi:hypothetical protein